MLTKDHKPSDPDTFMMSETVYFLFLIEEEDRLCGLVVRVHGYSSGGPGSIPGTTRGKKSSGSAREYN
jgi:hypothetical protein